MNQSVSRRDIVRTVTRQLIEQPENRAQLMRSLAAYIVTHGMADQTDLIINDIAHELYEQSGVLTVEVVSARALSDELRDRLTGMLKTETAATDVVLYESVDASLVGGFIARTADAEIDASVQTKLRALASLA